MLLIVSLISMAILLFIIFTSANYIKLTKKEALNIGEEKYLEFLWMVDGAFNNEKLGGEFIVNERKMHNSRFTCTYKNKKDDVCIGNNFEEAFSSLFASNVSYNEVYGDSTSITWVKYEKGKYQFKNLNNCNTIRMSLNQQLTLQKISDDKLTFEATMFDVRNQNNKNHLFVLVKENGLWKISQAYYHDLCEMNYRIK